MFRVTKILKISRSAIRTHHIAKTSPTLREGRCNRNSKNYILDVTFNFFFSDSRKVPKIEAGLSNYRLKFNTLRPAVSGTIEISRELYNA